MINFEIFIFVINQQFSNKKINWSACCGIKQFLFSVITLPVVLNRCYDGTHVATNLKKNYAQVYSRAYLNRCVLYQ